VVGKTRIFPYLRGQLSVIIVTSNPSKKRVKGMLIKISESLSNCSGYWVALEPEQLFKGWGREARNQNPYPIFEAAGILS